MSSSSESSDPWDKYRAMLDTYIEAYINPMSFPAIRDIEGYQRLIKENPEDITCMLLVAINRLTTPPPGA